MLDRQFGINPPSLEDDEDDTPLYTSSREALGDITGSRTPSIQAPKNVSGADPFAHLFGGASSVPQPSGKPAGQAAPADPFAHLFGGESIVEAAPAKKKNFVDRTAEVVDPAISRIFGDTKADESQIDKPGLARYREEQKKRKEEIAGLRAIVDADKDRSTARKNVEMFLSGALGGIGESIEWVGKKVDSDTVKSIADTLDKVSGALAPEDPTLSDKVVMGFGSVASFFLPGLGIAKGAKLLGAGRTAAGRAAANTAGAGGSAVLESAAIAQETYDKAMSETGNDDLANQQAWKAAGLNLPLSFFTNKIGLFGTKGGRVQRGAVAGLSESVQETSQNVLTNVLGFKPAGEGATESAFIGAITGGGTKMTFDAVNDYFENASPEERKDIVDKIIEGGKETRQSVFDSLMSNDATAKILRDAGISSPEDPGFVKFGAALGRFDREFAELAADPEVGPKLIANGILDPEDPRVQRVADRVLNAKQEVKGINEILEVTRSGVELTNDQKDQFNLLSAATNARELVDEITSNPELENVLKDMPGTAGFEGNRYNQIMGLWQKATIPAKAPTIAVDSKGVADTAAPNVRAGVEGVARQRAEMDKEAADAFRLAEARRARAQKDKFETGVQPMDTQAGGRPGGVGAKQEFAYFNPVIKDGQMVSGDRVEVVSGDQILDRITLGGLQVSPERAIFLRFLDRPGQPEFPVPVSVAQQFVKFYDRPEAPRAAQDFAATAVAPRPGVMTDPEATRGGPRLATDRITTDQSQQFVAADQTPPGTGVAPVRGGQTFEAEPVSEKLEAPGAARAKATSQRLSAQGEGQTSTQPAASTGGVPGASQTPSQPAGTGVAAAQQTVSPSDTPAAARAKQVSKGKTSQPEGTTDAAQEGNQQQGGQQQRPGDVAGREEGGREDRQREAQEPQARAEDRRGGRAEEGRQGTLDLKRKYLGQDIQSIDELNRVVGDFVKQEDPNGTFKAARVPLGDLVGKIPGVGLIEQVAKLFGKRVVFFRVTEGADFFNGTILESDSAIFVNVASDKAHLRILGHELVHDIRKTAPKVYQQLVKALQPMLNERGFANYAELQKSEGVTTADKILEEAIGDIVGDRFGEAEFWQMMADNNPSTFKDVARSVMSFIDRVLAKIGNQTLGSETLVKDLRAARSEIAKILAQSTGEGVASEGSGFSMSRKAPAADVLKAKKFKEDNDILPYTSEGQIEIPTGVMFSIKREGKYGNHPVLGIPVNANGTVSLYYPTTNEEARRASSQKSLKAEAGKNRIYLTNESSARKVQENPGAIEQAVGGANVLVQVDPDLVQIDAEYEDGRKDFFIPVAEGQAFFNKLRMTKMFTLNKSRKEAISPDVTIANIGEGVTTAIEKWTSSNAAERKALVRDAKAILKQDHNLTTLLGENGKLEKTRVGDYGLTYDGKSVASLGFGMASAQKLNDKKLTTCPQSAICEALCLGETSGQNRLYGGEGKFRSGPRLSQYLKTEALVLHPEQTALVLANEIQNFVKAMEKTGYQPALRLNVTSDFPPKVFEALIKAFPNVQFYDYTKLDSNSIAPNHHITYSSTGASQVVNGKRVENPHSNWDRMVRRLNDGFNVAMAFSSRTSMPKFVVDEKTGQRFQVWNGDNYDARFLDPKPGEAGNLLNRGMIIGLTNKDRTTAPEMAAEKNNGFFLNYDAKDGDTLVINDQEALSRGGTKVIKIPTKKTPPEGGVSVSDRPLAFSLRREIAGQANSGTTQVATTAGSYKKAARAILESAPEAATVLDYGAGLGIGTDALREVLGDRVSVESYEPFPQRWSGSRAVDYTQSNEISGKYDAVVNLNVLNVLEPELRDQVARDIADKLAPGGVAIIGTRKWTGDIATAKNTERASEDKAVYVVRRFGGKDVRVYQKGFDGRELVDYLSGVLGDGFTVSQGSGIAANTAIIKRDAAPAFSRKREPVESWAKSQFGDRVAPNGKPVWQNFVRWFGDSQAVNEKGEPLVVYHGTQRDFDRFSKKGVKPNFNSPQKQLGFFFSDDPKYVDRYTSAFSDAENFRDGANTMPTYLSLNNPKIEPIGKIDEIEDKFSQADAREYRQTLERQGYDGVIFEGDTRTGFVREFVSFRPEQIKSAVGNNGNFDENDPGISFSRKRDPHKEAERQKLNEGPSWFQNLPPEAQEALRKVGAVPAKLTFRDRVDALKENLASRAVQGIFDPYAPIAKLDDTAYMQARMSTNVTGAFGHIVTDGEVKWDGGWLAPVKGTKGMLDILKQLPEGEIDRFMWWIAANRAEKLTREEREFLFSGRDIAALKRLNMPNMGTKMPTRPVVYAKVLGQLNKLNKSVLDVAKQSGLINQEQYNRFAADAFYVPFYRVMEDGDVGGPATAAGLVGQQFSKRLKGGKEQLNDLLANYMNNWEHIIHASAKNMAGRSTLDAAVDAGIATEVKGDPPKGSVKVMVDGKPKHYMVSDPLVLDAISSIYTPALQGMGVKIGSMFKRLFTRTVTISPTFKFYNNLIRDAITSQAISPELSNNPIANTYRGVKLMSKDNPLYNSMLVGGGLFKYSTWDEGDRHEYVKRLIDQGVDPQTILNSESKIKAFLSGAFQRYMEFGDRVENAQRAAIYDAAIKAGKSQLEASFAARQVIDFSLTGRWAAIRYAAAVLPFFNARVQGMYSLGKLGVAPTIRAARDKDASASDRQRAARFAAVTSAVTAATIALYLANWDDEDFKRREDWDRDSFWWIKINGVAWRIPKPFEIGAFATIVERGLEQIVDESVEGKVFGKRLWAVVTDQLSINLIPQLIRPAFDVYANKDGFRETDIESPAMRRLPIEDRVGQNTSYAARAMGAVSKEFSDILEPMIGKETADKVQFSPVQIDYLVKGYLGWVGTQALMLSDAAIRGVAGIESPTPRFQEQIPVRLTLGNTIQELPTRNSRYIGDFYRQAREINEIMAAIREYERARDFDKARELREKEGDKVELAKLYSQTQRRMSEINKELRRIRDDTEMTADEKRARMDQLEEIREEYAKSAEDARKSRR